MCAKTLPGTNSRAMITVYTRIYARTSDSVTYSDTVHVISLRIIIIIIFLAKFLLDEKFWSIFCPQSWGSTCAVSQFT